MKITEIDDRDYSPYQNVEERDYNKVLNKHKEVVLNYMNNGVILYRGFSSDSKFIMGDGNLQDRPSLDTKNYYMLVMNHDPAWASYPKRTKSFIGSTSKAYAMGYAKEEPLVVIPLENQPIAVCPEYDFWECFKPLDNMTDPDFGKTVISLSRFQHSVDKLLAAVYEAYPNKGNLPPKLSETSYPNLVSQFRAYDEAIKESGIPSEAYPEIQDMIKKYGLLNTFKIVLNPVASNFKVTEDISDLKSLDTSGEGQEFWLSGKVMFVSKKILERWKNENQ